MTFSQQELAPSRSWKPCFQNSLETYPIPNPLPTWRYTISHPSQLQCSSFCPWVLSLCFNKTTFLYQRHLQEFFLGHRLQTVPPPSPQNFIIWSPAWHVESFHWDSETVQIQWVYSLFFLYSYFRGFPRNMVLLEHFHIDFSGCNSLTHGYSTGRRKPAFWLEVSTLARMVIRPRNLMPSLYSCPLYKVVCLGHGTAT